ncbi:hypothetical protein WUBG_02295 [Wuchereria bancrofti]|uniref:Uncharacterized protein n=1 Tax=Wuchereria bancrofti TaxID=6293 RepID=J9EX72_WUCBA|nr:hypothetical protein WUBG_02295 [Wuchereria bancrofti]VDM12045.1 unnamed protein product [Wuchereria bancrofti]
MEMEMGRILACLLHNLDDDTFNTAFSGSRELAMKKPINGRLTTGRRGKSSGTGCSQNRRRSRASTQTGPKQIWHCSLPGITCLAQRLQPCFDY